MVDQSFLILPGFDTGVTYLLKKSSRLRRDNPIIQENDTDVNRQFLMFRH
jgi:hypothetical protein